MVSKSKAPSWATHRLSIYPNVAGIFWSNEQWCWETSTALIRENPEPREVWERSDWKFEKLIKYMENK